MEALLQNDPHALLDQIEAHMRAEEFEAALKPARRFKELQPGNPGIDDVIADVVSLMSSGLPFHQLPPRPSPLLDEIMRTGLVRDGENNPIEVFPTSLSCTSADLLYQLVRREDLDATLEVGLAWGISALYICEAHRQRRRGRHVAMDICQTSHFKSVGCLNVKRAGLAPYFRFHEGSSHLILARLQEERHRIGFAFIDGSHHFDYTLVDFFLCDKLLRPGGFLSFDDLWMPAVRRVADFVLANRHYERVPEYCEERVLTLRKTADEDRVWDHYVPF